jgi:hypothetical protein
MATEKKGQTKESKKDELELSEEELKKFFSDELANIPSPEEDDLEVPADEVGGDEQVVKKDETPPEPEGKVKEEPPTDDSIAKAMEKVPEQFRDEDFAATLKKMTDEWSDMQSRLTKRDKELTRLQKAWRAQQRAQTAPRQPQQRQAPPQKTPGVEMVPQYGTVDPSLYAAEMATRPDPIEEPEAHQQWMDQRYLAMGQQMMSDLASNMTQHNQAQIQSQTAEMQKQQYLANEFNSFRGNKEDFDDYRDDMMKIIEEHPYLNEQPGAIETVYEMAKERKMTQLDQLKGKMKPEGYDDLKKAIVVIGREIGKINKRSTDEKLRAAKQTATGTGGSGAVSPRQRLNPQKETELSEDDQVWQSIMRASLGGEANEGDANAMDLLQLEKYAKPIKGEL